MEDFTLSFPFTKVDESRRIVVGVATADNLDPSGDTVEFAASKKAFAEWEGNIREMHQPKAVGKGVDYHDVKVPYNGDVYDGIEVEAYISKGAEDTWQKVLDGTLKGFSIGGKIVTKAYGADPRTGRKARIIKDYDLGELSLVDNPANPAALITLVKRADGGGLEYALEKYDVFYCPVHSVAQADNDACPTDGIPMKNIGAVEENSVEIIRKFTYDYINNYTKDFIEDDELIKVTNSHNSPPKGKPSDKSQYADPANYKYPIDKEHIAAAVAYFNHSGQQEAGGYSSSEWAAIGRRIAAAATRLLSAKHSYSNGKIVTEGNKMAKLLNNNNDDNVSTMDFTDDQKETIMEKFSKFLFNSKDEGEVELAKVADPTPVVVNVYTSDIEKAAPPKAKSDKAKADAEDATDGGDDEDEENADGTPKAKAGMKKSADDDDSSDGGNEVDLEKLMESFGSMLDDKLTAVKEEISKSVDEKVEAIQKSVDEAKEESDKTLAEVSEKVEKVESSGAFKKSGDDSGEESDETIEKGTESFWGGVFVPREISAHLGYDS